MHYRNWNCCWTTEEIGSIRPNNASDNLTNTLSRACQDGGWRRFISFQLYFILRSFTVPSCFGTVSCLFLETCELSNEFVWKPNVIMRQEVLMRLVRIDYLVKQRCNSKASSIYRGIYLNKYLITTTLLLSNDVEVNPGPSTLCSTRNGTVMDGN